MPAVWHGEPGLVQPTYFLYHCGMAGNHGLSEAGEAPPIVRRGRSMSSEVEAYLEHLIETELHVGDRLPPERELAGRLDVSRTTVREALRELEQRRRIERRPGRGTTVLPVEPTTRLLPTAGEATALANVAELRLVVEPQIAGLAAARATAADHVRLEQTLTLTHAGLTPAESLALDIQFHHQLAAASRNPLLVSLADTAAELVHDARARSHATRAGRRSSVRWHRAIFDAVVAGDTDQAIRTMVGHLEDVAELVAEKSSSPLVGSASR